MHRGDVSGAKGDSDYKVIYINSLQTYSSKEDWKQKCEVSKIRFYCMFCREI